MNKLFRFPQDTSSSPIEATHARVLRLIILFMIPLELVTVGVDGFLAYRLQAWQLVWGAISLAFLLLLNVEIFALMRRGRTHLAAQILIYFVMAVFLSNDFLLSGYGFLFGVLTFILTASLASTTLPQKETQQVLIVAGVSGFLIYAIDLLLPPYRLETPQMQAFLSITSAVAIIVFGSLSLRGFNDYTLRTKLIIAFLLGMLIPIGLTAAYTITTNTRNQTNDTNSKLLSAAVQTASALDTFLSDGLKDVRAAAAFAEFGEYIELPEAERAGSETEEDIYTNLHAIARFDETYITSVGLMDLHGRNVADTNAAQVGESESDKKFFIETLETRAPNVSSVELDEGDLSIYFSAPVLDESGEPVGVLRIRYDAVILQSILVRSVTNAGMVDGVADLVDENHIFLGITDEPDEILKTVSLLPADKVAQLQAEGRLPEGTAESLSLDEDDLEKGLNNSAQQPNFALASEGEQAAVASLENKPWVVMFAQPQSTFLAPVTKLIRDYQINVLLLALLVAVAAVFVARFIANPVVNLTGIARQIADGNFNAQAKVESQDEIGVLASAFNSMTSRLTATLQSLDRRAAELATVAEVSTATATILETDKLLQAVVDLTKDRFDLYHSHIYLLDEAGENLVLASGAGEAGSQMKAKGLSIPLDREKSLVARAARERKGVTVNDVTQAPDFLPNPLLPNTRSELATPMIVGGKVIGVFDIQSDVVGRFTDADINIQTTLAAQVSTSIQNVRSFEQSKAQAELESLVNAIGQKIQRTTNMDGVLQTAVREIGLALGASRVSVNIGTSRQNDKVIES